MTTFSNGWYDGNTPKPPQKKEPWYENPWYYIWGTVALVGAMVATALGVFLQTVALIFCLAVITGKIVITQQPDYRKLFNEDAEYNA